jgi:HSP20 family protein
MNNEVSKNTKNEHSYMSTFKEFESRIENMLHNFWNHSSGMKEGFDFLESPALTTMPKIDVIERDKEILVKAELPGIAKDDIDVSIADRRLVIKGCSSTEAKEEKGDYLKKEISTSQVYRSIYLPAEVDEDQVKTSFKDGLLKLTIPKHKNSQRKKIPVE